MSSMPSALPQPVPPLLSARLDELRLVERIAPATGDRVLADRLGAQLAATEALIRPDMPSSFNEAKLRAYTRPTEIVRIHRLCSLLQDGDRVVDIGVGGGYVLAALFANVEIAELVGVDITNALLEQAGEVVAHNGLENRVELSKLDVTQMPSDWLTDKEADLILMFEVLEHVLNPAAAMQALSDAMTDEILVFSVPIQGRIEACWGHRHAFDSDAIISLLSAAGLTLQYAEALFNTWAIFAVTKSTAVHPRTEQIAANLASIGDGVHVAIEPIRGARLGGPDGVEKLPQALNLDIELDGAGQFVEFDTPNMALFRIECMIEDAARVDEVWFEGLGSDGEVVCRWDVNDIGFMALKRSYPFRPGWPNRIADPTVAGSLRRIHRMRMYTRSAKPCQIVIPRVVNGQFRGDQLEPFVA